jgi:hypothetical protein
METVHFAKVVEEDLDIGEGTVQVRLADGSLPTAHRLSLPSLLLRRSQRITASAGVDVLTATGLIPAGARVAGVTTEVLTGLGTTQGLTAFTIGDPVVPNRWGTQTTLTTGSQTDQGDFGDPNWQVYTVATDVQLAALGGLFDATGHIEVTAHYFFLTHRSA